MSAVSGISNWTRPSFLTDTGGNYVSSRDGAKHTLEAIINCFDWMAHLGINKPFAEKASGQIGPIKQTFSVISFFDHLNALRHEYNANENSDGNFKINRKIFDRTMLAVYAGSDSALLVDSVGLISLKDKLIHVKALFWAPLLLLDSVNFFYEIEKVERYKNEMSQIKDLDKKNFYNHKVQLSYVSILRSVTTVAMASIALVSILFGSLAQGILFTPVVMLGLTTAWLILNFVHYFYKEMIHHWKEGLPASKV